MKIFSGMLAIVATGMAVSASAQDHDRDRYRDSNSYDYRDRAPRLDAGTVIPIRTTDSIDIDKGDNRVYTGFVDSDVRGPNGRLVVPRGSTVELTVRYSRDNDLTLDLESVVVYGQRYAIGSDPKRIESQRDNSLVGSIVGAIGGGEVRGRAVRVPRDSVVTFRLARPLELGVPDRGEDRGGYHYHNWSGSDRR